ncbi:hypothetical protein [Micromonospora coerulea]|uniref:hypothetical protein n=1 Tax=Micromonospora coerulea TaxID=47856 RepID=UPI001904B67B|nr:hypothetical protein [Micromonospora veneta]
MHGTFAVDADRRIRPARTDAPTTAYPAGRAPGRPLRRVANRLTRPVRRTADC